MKQGDFVKRLWIMEVNVMLPLSFPSGFQSHAKTPKLRLPLPSKRRPYGAPKRGLPWWIDRSDRLTMGQEMKPGRGRSAFLIDSRTLFD
jgi:hypothetical protein